MVVSISGRQVQAGAIAKSLLADMVDLGIGVEADAGDAVEQGLVLVHGAADVERALDAVERAGLQRDLAERIFRRTLADEVEDAAGEAAP